MGSTGYLAYRHHDGVWVYSDPTVWTALLEVQLHPFQKSTTFKLYAGRFRHGDEGLRLDMMRTFGWLSLRCFGVHTSTGTTAGVNVGIPLSHSGWPANGTVQVRAPEELSWTYRFHIKKCGYILDERNRLEEVTGQ